MVQDIFKKNSQVVLIPINELVFYEKNNKIHTDEQIDQLALIIEKFKKIDPIRVDKNKVIEAGHARVLALKKLGYTHAPCIIDYESNELESAAFRIAHNKIADRATYDIDILSDEIKKINESNFDLDLLGMPAFEIEKILNTELFIDDIEKVTEFNENYNFIIKCSNKSELDFLKNFFKTNGQKITYEKAKERIDYKHDSGC